MPLLPSRLFRFVVSSSFAFGMAACGPGNIIAKNKSISDVDDQTTTCKVAKDPLNPMIVEWPATSKVNLDRASKGGLVVVSYAGCTLKVLQGCSAKGNYTYTGVTPARDRIDIASQDDLFARLPLGAISLKGELDQGGGLRLDYIAVGQRVASDPPTKLEGDCDGATHYVRTITLGAYALNRTAKAHAAGAVEVNHAGAGIERSEADTRINSSGDVDKCGGNAPSSEDAATSSGCGAPLQLDLAPLNLAGAGVVSGGFGQNLGSIGKGPTDLQGIDAVGSASLKDVDPDYLQLLQNAKHADKDPAMKPIDKSNAWGALADYKGKNPTRKLAEERRDAWEKQAADLEKLKEQYLADKAKLDKLLALDDDTVPKASKVAYKKEFAEVYEPWKSELGTALGAPVAPAADMGGGTAPTENKLGSFRVDVEGGLDTQQLKYSPKTSSGKPIYLPNTPTGMQTNSFMEGDAGGSGGFVGAILTLPQIPAPGFGLSAIVRYSLGADVSRIMAGAGMRFAFVKPTTSSGIAIGLWASYVKLLAAKDNMLLCPQATGGKGCKSQYDAVIDGSSGGADFRVGLMYDLALGDIFALTFGGTLSYAVFPYTFTGTGGPTSTTTGTASDLAQGVGATLNAGLGAHF